VKPVAVVFELMSKGNVARLPDDMEIDGLPKDMPSLVILLMPYNRALVGTEVFGFHEKWIWGKLGDREWSEIVLYDEQPHTFKIDTFGVVTIGAEGITQLRRHLLAQLSPPGDHLSTLALLSDLLKRNAIILPTPPPSWNQTWSLIERDRALLLAYWGLRWALTWDLQDMVRRLKLWILKAKDAFDEGNRMPRIWFSITGEPSEVALSDWGNLGFGREHLRHLEAEGSNPTVIRIGGGYFLQYWQHHRRTRDPLVYRVWLYLPTPLWEELRDHYLLSLTEVIQASWGYLEAVDAEKQMSLYSKEKDPSRSCASV
jgi:hypothetical protein